AQAPAAVREPPQRARAGPHAPAQPARRRTRRVSDLDILDHLVRPAAGEPQGALILLHGRGTSEHDLHPLLDLLDPQRRLVRYTPAPPPPPLLAPPPGAPLAPPPGGRHWYVVPRVGYPDPQTFFDSLERLE